MCLIVQGVASNYVCSKLVLKMIAVQKVFFDCASSNTLGTYTTQGSNRLLTLFKADKPTKVPFAFV